jgi:4-amino-4-deoxy-L-arabinose transferase-like glycosyltransferase
MHKPLSLRESLGPGFSLVVVIALVRLALHLWTNTFGGYGYFRDELYYLACADHLDIGYVDHPPLSIFILAVCRSLFGDSLFALRLVPAVIGAVTVLLTGRIAAAMGGGKTAQVLAAIAACLSPILVGFCGIYSMNALDVLFWTMAISAAVSLVQTGEGRMFIPLGIAIGLGAMNKIGILWLAAGLTLGLLLSPYRSLLWTRWALRGAFIALLLFTPFVIWNILNNFAHLEFIRNATIGKYSGLTPLRFLMDQILIHNPFALPLWIAGLAGLFLYKPLAPFRFLGIAFVVVAAILIINGHSKAEYLAAAFPLLFAAGGVCIEAWTAKGFLRYLSPAYALVLVLTGLSLVPLAVPVLPVTSFVTYASALGVTPGTSERKQLGSLPQFYADMFGWPEKAAAVAAVYNQLTPDEKARCAIFGDNYGRSASIDFFGRHYGLPRSIGNHNNYWLWGPRGYTGDIVIVLGGGLKDKQDVFASVEVAGTTNSPWCMPYENDLPVYLCRGLRVPLSDAWGKLKHYE